MSLLFFSGFHLIPPHIKGSIQQPCIMKKYMMKVLVSYLGRRQIFSLQENDTTGQMTDLRQQVFLYFEIPSGTKVVFQRFNKEWDTYLDLDDGETIQDHDKLEVIVISEPTTAKKKSESGCSKNFPELVVCKYY